MEFLHLINFDLNFFLDVRLKGSSTGIEKLSWNLFDLWHFDLFIFLGLRLYLGIHLKGAYTCQTGMSILYDLDYFMLAAKIFLLFILPRHIFFNFLVNDLQIVHHLSPLGQEHHLIVSLTLSHEICPWMSLLFLHPYLEGSLIEDLDGIDEICNNVFFRVY